MASYSEKRAWATDVVDEAAVGSLARRFARAMELPAVLYLRGDLGAGKTTFARAYIQSLGYSGYVKSPSYGLLETYQAGGQKILHLDLYRIEDPEELEYLAIRDLYDEGSVMMVEWPDRGLHHLPAPDLVLEFGEKNEVRFVVCLTCSERGRRVSERLEADR